MVVIWRRGLDSRRDPVRVAQVDADEVVLPLEFGQQGVFDRLGARLRLGELK